MNSKYVLLLALLVLFRADARVMINEFMTVNTSIYPDLWDFEDFPDWVELYNDSSEAVDLSDYYLSDNFSNPEKWLFPSGTGIDAEGFLLLFADGDNVAPGTDTVRPYYPYNLSFTTRNYHTNFKLSGGGEMIALSRKTDAGTVLIDTVVFSQQVSDVSMGRNPDDNMQWYQYDQPTPGAANTTRPKKTLKYAPSVAFSVAGGFYDEEQTIELSNPSDLPMYYTTNGSAPTAASQRYSSPIALKATSVIRARCIDSLLLAGPVTTNTYFIGEKKRSLMVVSIVADSSFLWNSSYGIYKNSLKGKEIPASLEFFESDGTPATSVQAGISPGSLTSYDSPQKPLQVALKDKYGDDFIVYQLFAKPIASFSRIRLRNSGDAWATNLMGDGMVEAVCRGQLNNATQAYRPVIVYLNGEYWGIQDIREQFDPQFFTSNFNVDPTTLNEIGTSIIPPLPAHEGWEVNEGTWDDYQSFMSVVRNADMSDAQAFDTLDALMDINSFIDFICAEDYAVNVSWGHNIELWKVRNTKWRWLLTDFDRGFILPLVAIDLLTNGGGGISGGIMMKDTLFSTIINNKEFRNRFLQRFAAHLNSTFHPSRMGSIIDSISGILEPEMPDHIDRWKAEGGIESIDFWNGEIAMLKVFAEQRPAIVFAQLEALFSLEGTARLSVAVSTEDAGEILVNGVLMCNGSDAMTYFKGVPLRLTAVPRPGYAFVRWDSDHTRDTLSLILDGDAALTAVFEKAGVHGVPALISADTTFDKTDFAYVASGDVEVEKGATLTIGEGVSIVMPSHAGIYVRGKLLVEGTGEQPVRLGPDTANGATDWGAICFDDAEDTSVIEYAVITGTTLGRNALNHKAGINGNNSRLVMDHITMSNIIYPMYFEGGSMVLRNSSITVDHICNGGIHIGRGGAVVEDNLWVSTGKTINTDAVDLKGVEDGIVRGNRIFNFNGFNSDGIDLGEAAKNILVEGNYIYGNRDKGISVGGRSTCTVRNNIVVGCDLGIGVKDSGSYAELDHNTFVRNNTGIAVYEKVFPCGGGKVVARNTIISASRVASVSADAASSLEVSYSLSDMDIIPGVGNLVGNPKFIDPIGNNFQVDEESMSLEAGAPEGSGGVRADIGAEYEYDSEDFPLSITGKFTPPALVVNEIMHKDRTNDSLLDWIELYNPGPVPVSADGWTLSDGNPERIFIFPAGTVVDTGEYLVVCRSAAAFSRLYPGVKTVTGDMPFGLGNTETIVFADSSGSAITSIRYSIQIPWPTGANGDGSTLECIDPYNVNCLTYNWAVSEKTGGTPGARNSVFSARVEHAPRMVHNTVEQFRVFPNPLRTFATIAFSVPEKDLVAVSIFSVDGRKVATLLNEELQQGNHYIRWQANGRAPGMYLCTIKTRRFTQVRKLYVQ
ncbi:MAG: CotH kinase family protein [Chitinispirillaceae bacterium]|nr:CotH kinase family protein [Chitinispirillaceae bacterium]